MSMTDETKTTLSTLPRCSKCGSADVFKPILAQTWWTCNACGEKFDTPQPKPAPTRWTADFTKEPYMKVSANGEWVRFVDVAGEPAPIEERELAQERDFYALLRGICEDVIDWKAGIMYDCLDAEEIRKLPLTAELFRKLNLMYEHPLDNKVLKRTDQIEAIIAGAAPQRKT